VGAGKEIERSGIIGRLSLWSADENAKCCITLISPLLGFITGQRYSQNAYAQDDPEESSSGTSTKRVLLTRVIIDDDGEVFQEGDIPTPLDAQTRSPIERDCYRLGQNRTRSRTKVS